MGISWNEVEEAAYLMRDEPGTIFTNAQNKQKLWGTSIFVSHPLHPYIGELSPPSSPGIYAHALKQLTIKSLPYTVQSAVLGAKRNQRIRARLTLRDGTADKLTSSPWPPSPPAATAQSKASAAFQMTAITSNPDDAHYLGQHLASNYVTVIT